ncbi:FAD-dependent monooxygenase [Bosea caraganae]|uniref:FAD-dependent monooxygenase n=1 Tax=Bosea caraganae TaxID=2763117 RepID=A0A370L5R3_9HYPH|nr:NAD(P)/FAD-dependent oxidoreductase [Bosea caraganae]RDJ24289.1 FAD-dependent monooxygenase [Bosea caraganae]RDJ30332.1 FAD-dependent monooxygenase [Bosea caraganae]
MRQVDIAIIGAGLAGSAAAVLLGRSDHEVVLVDPHPVYRPDFRCEKLAPASVRLLRRMGLAGLVLPQAACSGDLWIARFGRVVDRMPIDQYGILYQDLVNAVRAGIPDKVPLLAGTVAAIRPSDDRQIVTLMTGEEIEARLVVLANGLNWALRRSLGITCRLLSPVHSTTLGFDIVPLDRCRFAFDSLTYYGERPQDRTSYLTLFRMGEGVRANLMTYRTADDPWLQEFRATPEAALLRVMPGLAPLLGRFGIVAPIRVRPADLYVAENLAQPGIVLVGDAFATSCPAAGTGTEKALNDVWRLCEAHVPHWFASDGMAAGKLASFYDDPEKQAVDRNSEQAAHALKAVTLMPGPAWQARRWGRFGGRWLKGVLRRTRMAGRMTFAGHGGR